MAGAYVLVYALPCLAPEYIALYMYMGMGGLNAIIVEIKFSYSALDAFEV